MILELIEQDIMVVIWKEPQLFDYFKILTRYSKNFRLKLIKVLLMRNKKEVNEYTERYIKICILFDSLFSLSRILCGKYQKKQLTS